MPFIYDNLTAAVVGMTVLLILVSIQMRTTKSSVAQSARNMALKQAETLATWMEQDLEAMGRNLEDDETVYSVGDRISNENSPTGTTLPDDTPLTFHYRKNESSSKTTIEYNVATTQTANVNDTTRTLYELNRDSSGVSDGESSSTLGYFDIRFVDEDAQTTTNEDSIRGIRAHFSVVSPFRNDETTLHEVHRMVVVPYTPALE